MEPNPNPGVPGPEPSAGPVHRRRPRYAGKHPRRFEQKYKEHDPLRFTETVEKVIASGKTPAGTHRPVMTAEILEVLAPGPGDIAVDCTLGYGGHAEALLQKILPGGHLVGIDIDPIELPKTEARLRVQGFGPIAFSAHHSNYAGISRALTSAGYPGADLVIADLGVSSMQLDNPERGFSYKGTGPLDLRMNPLRGQPASALLARIAPAQLRELLEQNADEPRAEALATALAGKQCLTTIDLVHRIHNALPRLGKEEREFTVRRVFQALRIEVNDEFAALEHLLRSLPHCLKPGGRAAILTFHSGEDRRVKKAFEASLGVGVYDRISADVIRPGAEERRENPRSTPAKLRWARRAASSCVGEAAG
jgi:16S rRNA (cytosine1402-N4)-methyltransferase